MSTETIFYGAALAVLAAVIVGVVPAAKATGSQMQSRLKYAAAGGGGMRFGGGWTAVIVGQVAVTVVFVLSVVSIAMDFLANEYRGGTVAFPREKYLSARLVIDREPTETTLRDLARRLSSEADVRAVTYATAFPGMKHAEFFVEKTHQ